MSSVPVTIQELFESGQSPIAKYAIFWKAVRANLVSTRFSSVWKRQARPSHRWGALQVARLERLISSKTSEKRSEEILEESCKNWVLLLVWAMERRGLCLRMIWTCLLTRLPRLSYCLKPQRPRDCKEQSFFWRIWEMARNLRSCEQMRSYSLSSQFTSPHNNRMTGFMQWIRAFAMTGFMQWIRVTSPWMTDDDVSETETCFWYDLGRGNLHRRDDSPHLHWRGG